MNRYIKSRKVLIPIILAIFIIVPAVLYATSTSFVGQEAENGSLSGNATLANDVSASGSQAVKFITSQTNCETNNPFTVGGPDPWGGCWPGNNNTGVPSGTVLTNYSGSCTITVNNTTINAKTISCGPLVIRASNVTITNSFINDGINIESSYCGSASLIITDSQVDMPETVSGGNSGSTGILRCNFTANRVEITGGRRSLYCVSNCIVENSWVHAQGVDTAGGAHFSGMRMEQDGIFRHNSITCEATRAGPGSGCSAGLTGYGDFAPVQNNLVEKNLFYRGGAGGSTICAYGGSSPGKPYSNDATDIRFISNRFVKGSNGYCGNVQTVLGYDAGRPGNQFTDNLFDNGTAVVPRIQ